MLLGAYYINFNSLSSSSASSSEMRDNQTRPKSTLGEVDRFHIEPWYPKAGTNREHLCKDEYIKQEEFSV